MCNLYRMTKNVDEVALWFDAVEASQGANFAGEVYPGYPGVVIAEGAVRRMNWGFPLQMKGKGGQPLKPRPVNNTRTDKLDSFFWRYSFEERRCIIPVTAWAEAEGAKGRKMRTWLSRPDAELIAVAGIWRSSEEWGDVYSMVMTDSAGVAAECHDRMPVLLDRDDWAGWTDGSTEDARALCVPWTGQLEIERTEDPWTKRV
ncbi:MAG: SOS response-associated peptidase family protein [Pseudomonadota bacterium]|jgi:putative SOS response-associated peptidase YedK|nr:SOS response-associated peptidase family protein [Pseudomonadota bacterium]